MSALCHTQAQTLLAPRWSLPGISAAAGSASGSHPRLTIASRPKTLRTPAKRIAAVPRQLRMFPALRTIGAGVTQAHHLISVCCRCSYLPTDAVAIAPGGVEGAIASHATTRA